MKKYLRCLMVEAQPMTRGTYNKKRGWTLPKDENPADRGYIVKYPDGYVSWCPREQFEKYTTPLEDGTKITPGDIVEFKRDGYQYCTTESALDGKPFTLLETILPTGFTILETSTCVDPKNYSEDIGCDICSQKINDKLWAHLGFMLAWATHGLTKMWEEVHRKAEEAEKQKKD